MLSAGVRRDCRMATPSRQKAKRSWQYGITYVAPGYNTDNHLPQAGAIPVDPTRAVARGHDWGEATICKGYGGPQKDMKQKHDEVSEKIR